MLAYLQTVGAAADLGGWEATVRSDVECRAAQLATWTAAYPKVEPEECVLIVRTRSPSTPSSHGIS